MVLVDGVLTQTIRRVKDTIFINYHDDNGEAVRCEAHFQTEAGPLTRKAGLRKGELHGDVMCWSPDAELTGHFIFEDGELVQVIQDTEFETIPLTPWQRLVRFKRGMGLLLTTLAEVISESV